MNIQIRPATLADMSAIHALVHELAVYENAPEQHTATIADYEKDFLANIFQAELAVDRGFEENTEGSEKVVGLIFYHFAYSTWRGRMMYLEAPALHASIRCFSTNAGGEAKRWLSLKGRGGSGRRGHARKRCHWL